MNWCATSLSHLVSQSLRPAIISSGPKLLFLFPPLPSPQSYVFVNNIFLYFFVFLPPPISINRDVCLKPGSLNLYPTHLLKSQLVLQEMDDVLKRFLSPSEGTRGETQGSIYYRALLPQRFLWRKWLMASPLHDTSPRLFSSVLLFSTAQDHLDFCCLCCWRFLPLTSVPEPQNVRICGFS